MIARGRSNQLRKEITTDMLISKGVLPLSVWVRKAVIARGRSNQLRKETTTDRLISRGVLSLTIWVPKAVDRCLSACRGNAARLPGE